MLNCTRCRKWTEEPDAVGLCRICHDYANCTYPIDVAREPGFVQWPSVTTEFKSHNICHEQDFGPCVFTEVEQLRAKVSELSTTAHELGDRIVFLEDALTDVYNLLTLDEPHVDEAVERIEHEQKRQR